MNTEANELRIKATNEVINQLVANGYTFFSSVLLHTDFNEVVVSYKQDGSPEVWSDSLFFHIPGRAILLRISFLHREYSRSRVTQSLVFHVLAEARPLEQLNELAFSNNLEFNVIPLDSAKWSSFGQPKIPYFVDLQRPSTFCINHYGNHFSESPDRWVRSVKGFLVEDISPVESACSIVRWLTPVLPYVAEGKILIPPYCGFTKDSRFVQSEALMRERLNLRVLREIADFGKFL